MPSKSQKEMSDKDSFFDVEEIQLIEEIKQPMKLVVEKPCEWHLETLPGFWDFNKALIDQEIVGSVKTQSSVPMNVETKDEHERKMKYMILPETNKMDSTPKQMACGMEMHQMQKELKQYSSGGVEFNPKMIENVAIGDTTITRKMDTMFRGQTPTAWDSSLQNEKEQKKSAVRNILSGSMSSMKKPKITEVQTITPADLLSENGHLSKVGALRQFLVRFHCIQGSTVTEFTEINREKQQATQNGTKSKNSTKKCWLFSMDCLRKPQEPNDKIVDEVVMPTGQVLLQSTVVESLAGKMEKGVSNKARNSNKLGIFRKMFRVKGSIKIKKERDANTEGNSKEAGVSPLKVPKVLEQLQKRLMKGKTSH